jgi:WD40 repeat protein
MDSTIRQWDVATGREKNAQGGLDCGFSSIDISPDGRILATAGQDGLVRLWDARTGKELRQLGKKHSKLGPFAKCVLAFSPDGRLLVTGGLDLRTHFWDSETGKELRKTEIDVGHTVWLTFSPDGKILATSTWDPEQRITLWDVSTGKKIRCVDHKWGLTLPIAFSPDGEHLFGFDIKGDSNVKTVNQWNIATGKEERMFEITLKSPMSIPNAALSPDGKWLAIADYELNTKEAKWIVRLWDLEKEAEVRCWPESASLLAFSPDSRILVAQCGEKIVCWEIASGKERYVLQGQRGGQVNWAFRSKTLGFSKKVNLLASGGVDATVVIWDLGDRLQRLNKRSAPSP